MPDKPRKGMVIFMKKAMIYIIAFVMILQALPVGAVQDSSIQATLNLADSTATAILSAGNENAGKSVVLRVFKEAIPEASEALEPHSQTPVLIWADEGRAGGDGSCTFSVNMQNYATGLYRFIATVESTTIKCEDTVTFYDSTEKDTLWLRIKDALKNDTASEIEWVIANRGAYLALDTEGYDAVDGDFKDEFILSVLGNECAKIDEFVTKFNQTLMIAQLYTCAQNETAAIIETIMSELSLDETNTYKVYSEDTAAAQNVCSKIKSNATELTIDNFVKYFDSGVVLKLLADEKALWTGYENVLKIYGNEADLSFVEYGKVTDCQNVINSVIALHDSFKLLSDLKSVFDSAISGQLEFENGENDTIQDNTSTTTKPSVITPSGSGSSGGGGAPSVKPPVSSEIDSKDETNSEALTNAAQSKTRFSDTASSSWAEEAIEYLAERGIINGTGNGKFEPEKAITRAEAVKMLVVAFGVEEASADGVFSDVSKTDWFAPYVYAAYKAGLINGVSADQFAPNEYISRQDIAVMINRMNSDNASIQEISFADSGEIASYAQEAVKALVSRGVINGTDGNRFAPKENCTRAQVAKIWFEMIKTGV